MAISEALGQQREVQLQQGTIGYRERGTGEVIVFVHGALVNADLWRKVVPELAKDFRCIAPDLPLGSHDRPLPADADLSHTLTLSTTGLVFNGVPEATTSPPTTG